MMFFDPGSSRSANVSAERTFNVTSVSRGLEPTNSVFITLPLTAVTRKHVYK